MYLKENPSAEKPPKKARGGVASRKAKANSIATHAARTRPTLPPFEDDGSRQSTPSKAGDLSFVLNAAPSGSPPQSPKSPNPKPTAPSFSDPPGFTAVEPAHNRMSLHIILTIVRARTKKRKMHDSYVFDDYFMEAWEEPDEAGYSEEEARRDLVEKEIRRRIKRESKKRRRQRLRLGALQRGMLFEIC